MHNLVLGENRKKSHDLDEHEAPRRVCRGYIWWMYFMTFLGRKSVDG